MVVALEGVGEDRIVRQGAVARGGAIEGDLRAGGPEARAVVEGERIGAALADRVDGHDRSPDAP